MGTISILIDGTEVLVDEQDFAKVKGLPWSIRKAGGGLRYAAFTKAGKSVLMHRVIMGEPDLDVDHKDGNGLDNRRLNLRIATRQQNIANSKTRIDNTSGIKGVCRRGNVWRARIKVDGKTVNIGTFYSITAAASARSEAAKKYFGEFARD